MKEQLFHVRWRNLVTGQDGGFRTKETETKPLSLEECQKECIKLDKEFPDRIHWPEYYLEDKL